MKTITRIFAVLTFFVFVEQAAALHISLNFTGGTPPTNCIGNPNDITNVVPAAAKVWELAIQDDHTVAFDYGWNTNGSGEHVLVIQGGSPNREIKGELNFNNDNSPGHYAWYIDPNPLSNKGYSNYVEEVRDWGGGAIVVSRYLTGGPTNYTHADLFTAVLHEIGHGLGMAKANYSFIAETNNGCIDITAPRPFAGSAFKLATSIYGVESHFDINIADRPVMGAFSARQRVYPSEMDIVTMAQLSKFDKLNLGLNPILNLGDPYTVTNTIVISRKKTQEVVTLMRRLSWINPLSKPCAVQESSDLKTWANIGASIVETNGVYSVDVVATNSCSCFRLVRP